MLSRAFAAEIGLPFVEILGPSIVSGMSGESERGLRERFDEAKKAAPCIIFLDEIDAIAPKRDTSQSQMEKRIVAQLLVSMDELNRDSAQPVIVLATTNRPDAIDPALRRGGRFDTEINIP
ncbi:Ribosome biogenesis ATPase rix7, partial [Teratosphaeriaceae sp. CCFEE 6253]